MNQRLLPDGLSLRQTADALTLVAISELATFALLALGVGLLAQSPRRQPRKSSAA